MGLHEIIIGFILPVLIDFINKYIGSEKIKFLMSLFVCIAVAVIFNLDKLTTGSYEELLGKAGVIFAEAQIVYRMYWKKSDLRYKMVGG